MMRRTCRVADTSWTDQPTCPCCGHVETDAWEIDFKGIDGDVEHSCASCGEDHNLTRNAIITYTSEPLKPNAEVRS